MRLSFLKEQKDKPKGNKDRFITHYVERLPRKPHQPFHPAARNLLKENHGIMVYRKDVSRVDLALADFSPEEADDLRKVVTNLTGKQVNTYQVEAV